MPTTWSRLAFGAFSGACLAFAMPAQAQMTALVAGKIDAAVDLCSISIKSGVPELAARQAEEAGFAYDANREIWSWEQGGDMIAVRLLGFDCELLLIGPSAEPDAMSEHIAAWGEANGFVLDRYAAILQMDNLIDGSNGETYLELKKMSGGMLLLTLSREGA